MQIAIIGKGAIAQYVARAVDAEDGLRLAGSVLRVAQDGAVSDVADLPPVDLLIDCAGHGGLVAHGAKALSLGINVLTLSLGALADDGLARDLAAAAQNTGTALHLATGAIGALDTLRAARVGGLDEVTYVGRKPPEGWRGSPAEGVLDLGALTAPAIHFDGSARDAALRYPKNANVAAAVALAGAGFDDTTVQLIADPEAAGNIHEIRAKGAFGQMQFQITGASLPDNPRSSALAAMSAVAAINQARAPIRFA